MNFDESLSYLLSLGHETLALKLGLRNTELLLADLKDPHHSYESVQLAGTNGKGSTAVMLDSITRAAGISTGLYTSPHLISITERIKINGEEISEDTFAHYATQVRASAERLVANGTLEALPTFFEHVTVIALLAFRERHVRLAILETGLGGRLDSTTVAGASIVALTPIALDHQEYLGEKLEQIAAEKAAIIRPGVNAIVAQQPPEALAAILKRSKEVNVTPVVDDCEISLENTTADGRLTTTFQTTNETYEHVLVGLRGRHQITNAALAIQLAESLRTRGFVISKANIIAGIQSAEHAGRLEVHPGRPSILLDGAHNPAAAYVLQQYLNEFVTDPITLIFGAMSDKKLEEMAAILFPAANHLILVQPNNPRAASVETLRAMASNVIDLNRIYAASSIDDALQNAKQFTPSEGVVCVTGSLYLVGEVKFLINPPKLMATPGN